MSLTCIGPTKGASVSPGHPLCPSFESRGWTGGCDDGRQSKAQGQPLSREGNAVMDVVSFGGQQ